MNILKRFVKTVLSSLGRRHPELVVRLRYFMRFHKRLDLDNPRDLNEKIQYLSLRTDTSEWTRLSDKYLVRGYVKDCGLSDTLNQLYGVWDDAYAIDFDSLPDRFILKTTHGSGDSIIVTDKSGLDIELLRRTLNLTLSQTYGLAEGNLHYSGITPRIIAEELLENDEKSAQYSSSLIDYKIWCFNGRPAYIWACTGRTKNSARVMTYDTNWNAHPEYSVFNNHYQQDNLIPPPDNLQNMLSVASRLAGQFPVVRVDLYDLAGRIVFGEMTFTSLGGYMNFYSEDFLLRAGNEITLPSC